MYHKRYEEKWKQKHIETEKILMSLMEQYGNELYRFCYLVLWNSSAANRAVQETFLQVSQEHKEQQAARDKCCLFRIAIKVCKKLSSQMNAVEPIEAHGYVSDLLVHYIKTMNPFQREIFLLRFYIGMSEKEISHIVCIPRIVVRKILKHYAN